MTSSVWHLRRGLVIEQISRVNGPSLPQPSGRWAFLPRRAARSECHRPSCRPGRPACPWSPQESGASQSRWWEDKTAWIEPDGEVSLTEPRSLSFDVDRARRLDGAGRQLVGSVCSLGRMAETHHQHFLELTGACLAADGRRSLSST